MSSSYLIPGSDFRDKNHEKLLEFHQKIDSLPSGATFRSTEFCKELNVRPRSFSRLLSKREDLIHVPCPRKKTCHWRKI